MPGKKDISYLIKTILVICLAVLIISIIVLSLVPPVSKDALVHHLAVPKLYLKHGGIYEIPFMEFSYYPMNLDLLYLIPLYFGSDIAPKFIHFTFGLLSAWLIFYYLRRRTNTIYALGGSVFFLSMPIIVKLSTTVYVDLGEIFFSFAALLLIMKWLNTGFKSRFLVYAGIMCGLALGTKYNGLVTFIILSLFVPFLSSRYAVKEGSGLIRSVKNGMIFLIVSLLVFSPWMIRNYHWKNNPVYPLYNELFNPQKDISNNLGSGDKDEEAVEMSTGIFTYRSIIYNETGWEVALLPVRIFFQGEDGDPQYFDGRLNPFLLVLTLFAFYRSRDEDETLRSEKKILLFFSILVFSLAFFSVSLRIRYIAAFIPPLTVLSAFGLMNLIKTARRMSSPHLRKICVSLVIFIPVYAFALNAVYLKGLFEYVNPIPFITGEISRDGYIEEYIPEYPVLAYINHNLEAEANIFLIYTGKRGYYCDRDYLIDNDMAILKRSITRAETAEDILKDLKQKGITHLVIGYRLFEKWMNDNFPKEKQELTQRFFREDAELLYYENGFGVLDLKVYNSKLSN